MTTPRRIGLASRVSGVTVSDLARVAAAISLQVSRDFMPIWNVPAVVSALPDPDSIPPGLWPVFLVDDTGFEGALGLHLTEHNQPYALAQMGATWSLTVAHEVLEMLVDPSGNKLQSSTAIKLVNKRIVDVPGKKVEYLVEVADPTEDAENAYMIDDVMVCDFYTPNFFDWTSASGVRYSFTGKAKRPREILKNGYISWRDPLDGRMHQIRNFDNKPEIVDLGSPSESTRRSLRGFVDSKTPPPVALSRSDMKRAAGGYQSSRSHWMQTASAQQSTSYNLSALRSGSAADLAPVKPVVEAIQKNEKTLRPDGATRAYAGWQFRNGWITRQRAIVVHANRADVERVRQNLPPTVAGLPVEVRLDPREDRTPAQVAGLLALQPGTSRGELALPSMPGEIPRPPRQPAANEELMAAKAKKPPVTYKSPPGHPFKQITAQMTLRIHVSPDEGWTELEPFLTAPGDLVVGMYQCTAPHIEMALEKGLGGQGKLMLTMDSPPDGKKREQTVEETEDGLKKKLKSRESFAWALSGLGKMAPAKAFPTSYHIKVAVKGAKARSRVWISSGNFNTANQPAVKFTDKAGLAKAARSSDRDWHVICESQDVADFFRAYLANDYQTANKAAKHPTPAALTAALTAAAAAPPAVDDMAGLLAAAPKQFFETKVITGKLTVRPLLTPDKNGYRAPILELIKSAQQRFYMQTQYIHTVDPSKDEGDPSHMDLIDAVADLVKKGVDVKLITSEYEDAMWIEKLQDAGIDAVEHLRIQKRVHNKGIVVDSKVSVISSQNWSPDGTGPNRDAGLIIYNEDASKYLEEIFLHDWTNLASAHLPS